MLSAVDRVTIESGKSPEGRSLEGRVYSNAGLDSKFESSLRHDLGYQTPPSAFQFYPQLPTTFKQ